MREVKIPRFLHEFFGERQTLNGLILIGLFSVFSTLFTVLIGLEAMSQLKTYRIILLIVLMVDIYGGVIANFTRGTKEYYDKHPKLKKIFVIIHPHAIVIFLLAGLSYLYGIYFYAFLVASNVLVRLIKNRNLQELLAIGINLLAAVILFEIFKDVPIYIIILTFGLTVKLIYAFSVDLQPVKS